MKLKGTSIRIRMNREEGTIMLRKYFSLTKVHEEHDPLDWLEYFFRYFYL